MLLAAAALVPTTALFVIQYRSLVELRDKTRIAVGESLRERLQGLTERLEERMRGRAQEILGPLATQFARPGLLEDAGPQFASVRRAHPEIEELFLVSDYSCKEKDFAVFETPAGSRRIEGKAMYDDDALTRAGKFYKSGLTAAAGPKPSVLYWQGLCEFCAEPEEQGLHAYVFLRMFDPKTGGYCGYVGMELNQDRMKDGLIPQTISGLVSEAGLKDSGLALAVYDDRRREVYRSAGAALEPEVTSPLRPVFNYWHMALGYEGATLDSLARDNFRKSLLLTIFVLALLVVGVALTLRAAARELRLAEAKSTFVSNVSHELKTPLALIRLFAETLELGRVRSPEKAREYYRVINHESRRLTQLIDNVLDFGQIEAGRKRYSFAREDVGALVEGVVRSYEYQLTSAGFELKTSFRPGLLALVDRDSLSQAVLNLLNNAVKYSRDVRRIEVSVGERGGLIAIEVADAGVGIPAAEHEKIFEKFYRVGAGLVHETKGSGLGLSLVKHIVQAHGGRVRVESAPGKGSRFTIFLSGSGAAHAEAARDAAGGGREVAESLNS